MEFLTENERESGTNSETQTNQNVTETPRVMTPTEQQQMIRQVQGDTTKTAAEKSSLIRDIMKKKVQAAKVVKQKCTHYDKKCSNFFFDCCQTYDSCHRCHAEYNECTKRDITSITCVDCNTDQAISNKCINCKISFSQSHCPKCKIWTSADIFHCDGCGICRVGNADDYAHCDNCNGCFSATQSHKCLFFKPLDQMECLVCMESAHTSQDSIQPLPCGHVMHSKCLDTYLRSNQYKCPTCRKSVIDMTETWENYKSAIAAQPMPDEYKKDVEVLCYDCGKDSTAAFHFAAMECGQCGSFNTSQK